MGQRKRIDRFNDDLDAGEGTTREIEDAASRKRIAGYSAAVNQRNAHAMAIAIDAENDNREAIGLERIEDDV